MRSLAVIYFDVAKYISAPHRPASIYPVSIVASNSISSPDHALWYVAPGRAEIRPVDLGPLADGQVRVRCAYSALSRGTESLILAGRVPEAEYERMKSPLMEGAFPFPVKYGYCAVGRVVQGPAHLTGKAVFCLGPHQTTFDAPQGMVQVIPDGVPLSRAVLAANMETALNATWNGSAGPSDKIAVVGAGVVGALTAYLCGRLPGAEVTLVDVKQSRAKLAQQLGVRFATPEHAPKECDIVFHATAHPAGLATAISLAGNEADVVELSWYGDGMVPAPLGGAFHSKQLRLVSSQVGHIAPSRRARWDYARRLQAALALLDDPRLDALLEPAIAFADLAERVPTLLEPDADVLCQLVSYPSA